MISGEDSGADAVVPRTRRFTQVALLMAIVAFVGIVGFAARSQGTLVGQEIIEKDGLTYQDLFTGKVILTANDNMKLVDDSYYEVDAKYLTRGDEDLGFDVIANQEDVVYWETQPNRAEFMEIIDKIIEKTRQKMDDEKVMVIKSKILEFLTHGPGNTDKFNNFQFFSSAGYIDLDGEIAAAPILVSADDSGWQAKIYYFKDLMKEIKA
eukprot:TRINITY_DN1999_c0_g1_i2.p1 TRINITY_DN1999_c0_g1~~TRINITY_DN1999_c0_g1_i2.p1  ORF type:complete len:209 (+),score=27.14 TRINITY_DN1999_c0_g1_i2:97-723(+)